MSNKNSDFKPYIPADRVVPEFTVTSVLIGIVLAIVFGAANAYLGLKVGMTISASIPAAVISMGIIRVILRRDSILENNLVQTIGSAGESVAAGAIFTLPALFLWAKDGIIDMPSVVTLGLVALVGGVLGVIFMVPLRQALIVEEHGVLPFPEGTACAEVLLAGEEGGSKAGVVFSGLGIAAAYKLISDGFKVFPSEIGHDIAFYKGSSIGIQVLPALAGVGYICGPKISSYMFAGGTLSWFVIMPMIALFGGDAVVFPGSAPISTLAPSDLWGTYVKYIGAGAVATGGIISLIKSFPLIVRTFKQAMKGMKSAGKASTLRTEQDIPMPVLLIAMVVIAVAIWLLPAFPVNLLGAVIVVVFGFFFATVSSRMVGLIGSSNNPVSGMAIATIIITTILLKATGTVGTTGMTGAICIGGIICVIAAIAGDCSQDLKTGFILGLSGPEDRLHPGRYPQEAADRRDHRRHRLRRRHRLCAVSDERRLGVRRQRDPRSPGYHDEDAGGGHYERPAALGPDPYRRGRCGVVRWFMERRKNVSEEERRAGVDRGVLYTSGLIAGEGLMGVVLAGLAAAKLNIDVSGILNLGGISSIISIIAFVLLLASLVKVCTSAKK